MKRSGTYVLAPTMKGATSTVSVWPLTVAWVEPICSSTAAPLPVVAVIVPLS